MSQLNTGDLAQLIASMPFAESLGIELIGAQSQEVRGRLPWRPDHCTIGGIVHGGALMAFADTVGAVCAFLNLPDRTTTATLESKTNLFRPVRGGNVLAVSKPLHTGRVTIVAQTDLFDEQERRVAQVTQSQAVLPLRG
ncbi:MAG: PaaI family thioesterase [Thermocrispum sp.]